MHRFAQLAPVVLQHLSLLPFEYLSDVSLSEVLMPTLMAACVDDEDTLMFVEDSMSREMFKMWVEARRRRPVDGVSEPRRPFDSAACEKYLVDGVDEVCEDRFALEVRLPNFLLEKLFAMQSVW